LVQKIFPEEEVSELDKVKTKQLSMDEILGIDDL